VASCSGHKGPSPPPPGVFLGVCLVIASGWVTGAEPEWPFSFLTRGPLQNQESVLAPTSTDRLTATATDATIYFFRLGAASVSLLLTLSLPLASLSLFSSPLVSVIINLPPFRSVVVTPPTTSTSSHIRFHPPPTYSIARSTIHPSVAPLRPPLTWTN
jgi:hypothetical protein